jgi:AraC-like DNA-binding protein
LNNSANAAGTRESLPVLCGAAGTYRERPVHPSLRQHFASVWFHAVPGGATAQSAVVPDGCTDLVWCQGAVCVAGPERRVKIETVPPGTTVVGLRFRPGSALTWLRTPMSEIVDARAPIECFLGAAARLATERICSAESPDDVARQLELSLKHWLPNIASAEEVPRTIFRIVSSRRDYSIPVTRQLSDGLGLSERTLRRRCYEAFGYGPKTLDRILRFQRFLELAQTRGIGGMSDLAVDTGYSDQSHLTREARELAGMTPSNIREQLTL